MQFGYEDYYGEEGCCLACEAQEDNEIDESGKCICYDCKGRQCYWYPLDSSEWNHGIGKGHCEYLRSINRDYDNEYDEDILISKRIREMEKAIYCCLEGFCNLTAAYLWVPKSQIKGNQIASWWRDEKDILYS